MCQVILSLPILNRFFIGVIGTIADNDSQNHDDDIEAADNRVVVYGWASGCAATDAKRAMLENADIRYTFYQYSENGAWQSLEDSAISCECHKDENVRYNPMVVVNGIAMYYPTLDLVHEYLY